MELDYRPENAQKNFHIISQEVSKLHDGEIIHVGNVRMIVKGLENARKRGKIIKALLSVFPNIEVEERPDRIVIKTSFKKKQHLAHLKEKAPQPLMADLRWEDALLNPVQPPKVKNVLLGQALMKKVFQAGEKKTDNLENILKMMQDIERKLQRKKADEKIQGVQRMIQQAEGQYQAKQWEKQLQEKARVGDIKKKFGPVVKQLLEKPVRLRVVDDAGAGQWLAQLQQKQKAQKMGQLMAPVHKEIKMRKPKKENKDQLARVQNIRKGLEVALRQIAKGTGAHRLKPVAHQDAGALQWAQQLQQQGGVRQTDKSCQEWMLDKSHNPFNKTNRGPKLHPGSPTFKQIYERCEDKKGFCDKIKNNKKKLDKYC